MKENKVSFLYNTLITIIISLMGTISIVFVVLYFETFSSGFVYNYYGVIISIFVSIISIITSFTIFYVKKRKTLIYKMCFSFITLILILMSTLYLLKISEVLDKFKNIDDFRLFIMSFGNLAPTIFVLIQFLQVVILPIPSFITVGAGVILFGPLINSILSCIGIILGSIVAFFIGRIFGVKTVKWLVGEHTLNKVLSTIKNKDKLILTFMFLLPLFPDDVLCFVAGITTINPLFFIVMIFITRVISIFTASYSMNNSIIPYNTWWGLLLWALFFIVSILIFVLIYKKGNLISAYFSKLKNNRK